MAEKAKRKIPAKLILIGLIFGVLVLILFQVAKGPLASHLELSERARQQHEELVRLGKQVYLRYCVGCHGEKGDGKGLAARLLVTPPRDFTVASFKFRTTPSGSLPTNEDLFRTISRGVPRSSMPSWILVSERERVAVIQYIKTFSDIWEEEKPEPPIVIGNVPEYVGTPESVSKGKEVYQLMKCAECHGEKGKGDGPSALTLKDDFDRPIKPFNFTLGILKGGPAVKDIYRTFTTGLDGTPMPSFADSLPEDEDRWHLVSYILELMGRIKKKETPSGTARRGAGVS